MLLDPKLPDPFEPFVALRRSVRVWQATSGALIGLSGLLAAGLVLTALRPPTVIVKERASAEPVLVSTSAPPPEITVADARNFFINMIRLRYGWTSLTVQRDLEDYLKQCADDDEKIPRLQSWIRGGVANHLALPQTLDQVDCKTADGVWHCKMQASLIMEHLIPTPGERPVSRAVTFVATLLPVPHSPTTAYGLVVGAMREFESEGRG
jgi:hypothetical protein